MKASDLLGQRVFDAAGNELGQIADLLTRTRSDGQLRVYAVLVTPGHRGRLFGYEREGIQGPWLIEQFSRWLHRGTHEVAWSEVRLRTQPDRGRGLGDTSGNSR